MSGTSGEVGGEVLTLKLNSDATVYVAVSNGENRGLGLSKSLVNDGWVKETGHMTWMEMDREMSVSLFSKKTNKDFTVELPETETECEWIEGPAGSDANILCSDGTTCSDNNIVGESSQCCKNNGGIARCNAEYPAMCATPMQCVKGTDYCCNTVESCKANYGGLRQCRGYDYSIIIQRKEVKKIETCGLKFISDAQQPTTLEPTQHLATWNCDGEASTLYLEGNQVYANINEAKCVLKLAKMAMVQPMLTQTILEMQFLIAMARQTRSNMKRVVYLPHLKAPHVPLIFIPQKVLQVYFNQTND